MSSSVEEQVGEITARDSVNEAISKAAMFGIPAQRPAETSADAVAAAGLTNEAAAPAAALPADGVAGDVDLESASSSDPALEVSSATSAEETITAVDEPAATEASAPAAVEAAAPAISEPSDQPSSTAPLHITTQAGKKSCHVLVTTFLLTSVCWLVSADQVLPARW